ncbi:MAG: C45 family peptidase [Myxococcota bacterium]
MLPIIDVRSLTSPSARGEAYGAQARAQIQRSMATYTRVFASNNIGWREAGQRARRYLEPIATIDATLIEEMEGIARGAGVELEDILALNCRSEILPSTFLKIFGDGQPEVNECTSLVASASGGSTDGQTWLAQNWDWVGLQRQALVVLQTQDRHGMPIDTLTEAGMLAKIGMNRAGLAVGLNMLRSKRDGLRSGVPVHVLLRHSLSCSTLQEVRTLFADLMQGVGFASASNMPCADAQGDVGSFEFSPAGWEELQPTAGIAVHTNHFVCPSLVGQQAPMECSLSTESRLRCARSYAARGPISPETIQALLRDESMGDCSVCRHPNPDLPEEGRVESVVAVMLNCTARRWWLAFGIPSTTTFDELHLPIPQQLA